MSKIKKYPDPVFRLAIASDVPVITNCVEAAYRHYMARIGKPPGPMLDNYSQVIQSHQVFVGEVSGEVAAVLVLIRDDNSILLDNIAVMPECQGIGLGTRLMQMAESEARKQGYSVIDLYTHELMTENIQIYKKLGYRVTDRRIESGYRRVYMRKDLRLD